MVEFCEKCGSMMLPTNENGKKQLRCNLCNHIKPITGNLINKYVYNKEISHPKGEEFKNLEKIKNWKEKEIFGIFKEDN